MSTKDRITQHILDLLEDNETAAPLVSSRSNAKRPRLDPSEGSETTNRLSLKETITMLMDSSDSDGEDESSPNNDQNPVHLLIRKSIAEYTAEKRVANDVNPLTWWKVNEHKYGLLFSIARQYLVTPPTSVPSERMFSGAGLLYTPHRNRLEGEKASKLLFLKFNIPLTPV